MIGGNGGPGVEITPGAAHAIVSSNWIGESLNFYNSPLTDGGALANDGPGVEDAGTGDVIGGNDAGDANMISGSAGPGVELEGSGANIANNLIGLDLAGTGPSPNGQAGILATAAGGVTSGENRISGNTIGGNTSPGIQLDQAGNSIVDNYIGTAGDHVSPLGNSIGILARIGPQQIGGSQQDPNTIAYNDGAGVAIVDPPDSTIYTSGVDVADNSIFGNGGLGIDLGDDGVTQNHPLDSTPGPNGFTNFPVLTTASSANGQFAWHGSLDAAPNTYYSVLVFANPACDPSGYGQGKTLVDDGTVSTDANGDGKFVLTGQGDYAGQVLSAIAITGSSSSSEFGPCLTVGPGVDLSVSQSVSGGAKVIAGDAVDVDIDVTNKGPAEATNIVLTDTPPQDVKIVSQPAGCPAPKGDQFSCPIGSLASGASEDVHVLLEPSDDAQTLTNTAEVTADQVQTSPGDNMSDFATAVAPNPDSPGAPEPSNEVTPTFGSFLRLDREAGSVTATLPNGQKIQLQNFALVPVGTIVQTTHGIARVTAALPGRAHKTSHAEFKYGRFKIAQPKGKSGLVDAVMDGSLSGCAAKTLRTGSKITAAEASASRRHRERRRSRRRRLWGHDSGGHYTISGNRGTATVRGTTWEVIDTCTTTIVRVYKDSVKVTGFGNTVPKHAIVKSGHQVVLRAG